MCINCSTDGPVATFSLASRFNADLGLAVSGAFWRWAAVFCTFAREHLAAVSRSFKFFDKFFAFAVAGRWVD